MKKAVNTDFQWIKPDGKPTQYFAELIQSLSDNGLGDAVSKVAPQNGQFLVYSILTKTWSLQPDTAPTNGQVLAWDAPRWKPASN